MKHKPLYKGELWNRLKTNNFQSEKQKVGHLWIIHAEKEGLCSPLTSDVCNVLPTASDWTIHRPEAQIMFCLCFSTHPTYSPNLCPEEWKEIKEREGRHRGNVNLFCVNHRGPAYTSNQNYRKTNSLGEFIKNELNSLFANFICVVLASDLLKELCKLGPKLVLNPILHPAIFYPAGWFWLQGYEGRLVKWHALLQYCIPGTWTSL